MSRLRLKTQLLISTLLIICALVGAMLLIVRYTVRGEIDQQVRESVAASVQAFQSVQNQRQDQLSRTAAMLADLPTLKALMTTRHAPTIQDGSMRFWQLAGSDLFVLTNAEGEIMALHAKKVGLNSVDVKSGLTRSLEQRGDAAWWYVDGRLYWIFIRTIAAGSGNETKELGLVAIGYQVDSTVAEQLALVAGSKIVLATGNRVIASTLSPVEEDELQRRIREDALQSDAEAREVALAKQPYQLASVSLHDGPPAPVRCYVLVPLERSMSFIAKLDRTILVLGISAVVFASLLLSFVSRTITHPIDDLVAGVRALAAGDYAYRISPRGSSEVVELGEAFSKMRRDVLESQRQRIETERIAALGRAASSISHDLRHHLAALVANAEFLYEADKLRLDRDEIYEEIKMASEQMTELLDSLRELSREHSSLSPVPASLDLVIHHALEAVLARPEFRNRVLSVQPSGDLAGVFDTRKMERAFFNLVLNACEATAEGGKIVIHMQGVGETFEIRVADDGPGIPAHIRNTLFNPFVSSGKPNGTGLGLAIVSKIVHDHYGSISVERTSEEGTVFFVRLPRVQPGANGSTREEIADSSQSLASSDWRASETKGSEP